MGLCLGPANQPWIVRAFLARRAAGRALCAGANNDEPIDLSSSKSRVAQISTGYPGWNRARFVMSEAQLGLALASPTILVFVLFMYRRGAIPLAGAIAAAVMAIS